MDISSSISLQCLPLLLADLITAGWEAISFGMSSKDVSANTRFNIFKGSLTRRWLRIKKAIKDLALQRVRILYEEALVATRRGDLELARRYVELAHRITERVNVRKPKYLRRGTCRRCLIPLIPGLTARFRVKGVRKYVIISCTCLLCGWIRRFPCRRVGG